MSMVEEPDWASLSAGEIRRRMAQELATQQVEKQDRLRAFGTGALWMAAVPFATAPVASLAGVQEFEPLVTELQQQGLVEGSVPPYLREQAPTQTVYTMTPAGRATLLGKYLTGPSQSGDARAAIADYGRRLAAPNTRASLPLPVARWAELGAFADDTERLVQEFDSRVQSAFKARDAAALLHWIDAAQPLDELLQRDADEGLSAAIKRASRQQELLARRAHDERQLRDFQERPEQVQAFRELVHGGDELWALHLFGVGGVGKTMALRHLIGVLAPDPRDLNAYTARVDFDYLNADYPMRDPGLLLWSFAQELRAYDTTGRATDAFDKADEKLLALGQRLNAAELRLTGRPTQDPRFVDAVVHFIGALQALDRRVILIVDTCEELSKIRPDGTIPENVQETFRILEALHDGPGALFDPATAPLTSRGVPSLRVVFAGRRPLARSGHGWRCPTAASPEAKPYLRLHELRGFTADDATRYLLEKVKVPSDYVDVIVRKAPDIGAPAVIEWDDRAQAPAQVARCNPYDLRFYADWVNEDPRPTREEVASATNASYVQMRILRRLEKYEPLRQLLPIAALVKHIGEDLLYELFPADKATAERAFERLRQQEWIDQRTIASADGTSTRTVLTVEEGLRRRLWAYFSAHESPRQEMLARAVDHLEAITLTRDLATLDWPVFDTALRVLDFDPARGVAWWKRVETRVLRERGSDWLLNLTGTLLGERNAAERIDAAHAAYGERENTLRAAVLASYAGALRLGGEQTPALAASWEEVQRLSDTFIVESERPLLRHRANCGFLAAIARRTSPPEQVLAAADAVVQSVPFDADRLDDALAGAAASVAAVDALVELGEAMRRDAQRPALLARLDAPGGAPALAAHLRAQRDRWTRERPDDARAIDALVAFSEMTAARALAMLGKYREADELFTSAMRSAGSDRLAGFADWEPPDRLDARIRLELARTLCPAWTGPRETLRNTGFIKDRAAYSRNLDVDRYFSLGVSLSAAVGPTPDKRALARDPRPAEVLALPVTRAAHGTIRPLYATTQRELAWDGFVDDAVRAFRSAPVDDSTPFSTVAQVERALGEILLRMRLSDEGEQPGVALLDSLPNDRGLLWAIAAQAGHPSRHTGTVETADLELLHAVWQATVAVSNDEMIAALDWMARSCPPVEHLPAGFDEDSFLLDLKEATLLTPEGRGATLRLPARPIDPVAFARQHPRRPIESLKILLRSDALAAAGAALPDATVTAATREELVERVGPRYAARLALAEADLVMFRLPAAARHLYEQAAQMFAASEDRVGEFLALTGGALASTDDASEATRKAVDAYARLVKAGPHLSLPAPGESSTPIAIEQAPRMWRPWLHRLSLLQGRNGGIAAPSTAAYWTVTGGRRLPPDVRRLVVPLEPGTTAAPAAPPGKSKGRALLENTFAILLGLGFMALGAFYSFVAFRWAARPVLPPETSTGTFVLLYIGAIVLLSVLGPRVRRAVRSAVAARSIATIVIEPEGSATSGGAQGSYQSRALELRVRLVVALERAHLRWLPPGIRHTQDVPSRELPAASGGLGSYLQAAPSLEPAIELIRPVIRALGTRTMRVRLACDEALAEPAWEALLQIAAARDGRALPVFRCHRVHLQHRRAIYAPARAPIVVTAGGDAASATLLKRAWEPVERRRGLQVVASAMDPAQIDEREDALVVHLLGGIEEGTAGLAFHASSREHRRQTKQGPPRALTPSVVAAAFPRATLIVIQPALLARPLVERGAAERENAMLTRHYACALFYLDVPAVLVLPQLDAARAAAAAAHVARVVGSRDRRGVRALEDLVVTIQRDLAKTAAPSDVVTETLLDTCVYCVDNWDGSLERARASRHAYGDM